MNVLVTGGAGYIGSVTVRRLLARNKVVILDNLSKGHKSTVPKQATFIKGDIADSKLLDRILKKHSISAIIHFAASIEVGESESSPLKYFRNNVQNSVTLLEAAIRHKVKHFVYSSSAAVYGNPKRTPIKEEDPKEPTNNYGLTKLLFERILEEYTNNYPVRAVALRYFNAAGADLKNDLGEDHDPESHLIPLILQVALGIRKSIKLFGTDYPTKDGTCLRDYIHVLDLADAHVKALSYLKGAKKYTALNLGSGKGSTVKQVVEAARKVTKHTIPALKARRRKGDPARLLASPKRAMRLLNWKPNHSGIKQILTDAWLWHKAHPRGYR